MMFRNQSTALLIALCVCSVQASDCRNDSVEAARERFNAATAAGDLNGIAQILAEDVVLVTGTDSDQYLGLSTQLKLWEADQSDPDSLSYVRETSSVALSAIYPIAMEQGAWTGTASNGDMVGGDYSAKWRCVESKWLLEAELFMTSQCSGSLCP